MMPSTLPPPSAGHVMEGRALQAGLTFLDLTEEGRLTVAGLETWFDDHVVAPGCMLRPPVVCEPGAGAVALRSGVRAAASAAIDLPRILTTARLRVVGGLHDLIASPSDDRFLRAAIFRGRVLREEGHWIARPELTSSLSGIVLSLFAVAILSDRSFFDEQMCVCDTCGRVSFDLAPGLRGACRAHAPKISTMSMRTVTGDRGAEGAPERAAGTTRFSVRRGVAGEPAARWTPIRFRARE